MIENFVKAWDSNKDKLREYISTHRQEEYDRYNKIVSMLFEQVINPYMTENSKGEFRLDNIHEID